MKKFKLSIALTSILAILALCACTQNGKENSSNTSSGNNPQGGIVIADADDQTPAVKEVKEYKNLEEYFADSENADNEFMIDKSAYEGIFSDIKVSVKENRMIYEYYYTDYFTEQDKVELKESAEASKVNMFYALRNAVDTSDLMELQFIYYDADGLVATDFVVKEDEKADNRIFTSNAQEGTIQYAYETAYGPDYWKNLGVSVLAQTSEIYSDVAVEADGNTLIYTFYFKENSGNVQDELESGFTDDYKKQMADALKNPVEFTDTVTLEYIYMNPDGTVAADIKFEG